MLTLTLLRIGSPHLPHIYEEHFHSLLIVINLSFLSYLTIWKWSTSITVLPSSGMTLFVQNEQDVNCTWLQDSCHEIWNDANGQLWLLAGGLFLHLTLHWRCLFAASATNAGSRVEGKRDWESTQVGTVPVHALTLLLLQCFPSQMSLAIFAQQWLCNVKSAQVLKLKLETELKSRIKEWLDLVLDLVWSQQAGGATGRPPQGGSGGAEDGAGHQGECGRHHQIRSTSQLDDNHGRQANLAKV